MLGDIKIQGLRTTENDEFLRFWDIVQKEAGKNGAVFFLDCGEGNDKTINDMEVSDLSGWLVPKDKTDEFEFEWTSSNDIDEKWNIFFCFVKWEEKADGILVEFH